MAFAEPVSVQPAEKTAEDMTPDGAFVREIAVCGGSAAAAGNAGKNDTAGGRCRSWREGDGPIGADDIIRFLSQVVRGKIGGKKPATVTERIRAATVLLKLYQDGEILTAEEAEEDALSRAVREFEEEGILRRLRPAAEEEA